MSFLTLNVPLNVPLPFIEPPVLLINKKKQTTTATTT
jgi:hypothetical protein